MPDFFIKQQSATVTNGATQDFTVAGFGTPTKRAALFFATFATATGPANVKSHIGFTIGATDGTRSWSVWQGEDDAASTTATGHESTDAHCFTAIENGTGNPLRFTFNSWITDGIRVNVLSSGPPATRLVTCVLIGGTGIADVWCGTTITPAGINTGTTVTAPGFQGDLMIVGAPGNGFNTFDEVLTSHAYGTLGIVQRNTAGNPHPQFSTNYVSSDTVNPSDIKALVSSNRCCVRLSQAADSAVEIQDFTSTGFSAFLRDKDTVAMTIGYLLIKLNGLTAKAIAFDSFVATGAQQISGITGIIPQFGMLLQNDLTAVDTYTTGTNGEVFGVGLITAAAQASHAIASDDGITPSNCECYTDTDPVLLRKDSGVFMDAAFSSFASGVVNLSVTTANGTPRKWAGVFVEAAGAAPPDPFTKLEIRAAP